MLYALQATYSKDFDTALEQAAFFLIPFALLYALLREVRWSRDVVLGCVGVLAVLAIVFCGIGFWEYERRELFWNPKVIAANQFESYFRVNSVFWDPNVYGRFLVLVILAVTALMLWSARARVALASAVVLAVLWAGLVLTFSQSSFAALLAGLAVLAALRWDVRRAAAAAAAALLLGGAFAVLFQDTLKIDLGSSGGLNNVTSGRADLIGGGVELFAKRPLQGYGSGLLRPRLPARAQGEPAAGRVGVAHDAGDRGGRTGPDRPGGLRRRARRGAVGAVRGRRLAGHAQSRAAGHDGAPPACTVCRIGPRGRRWRRCSWRSWCTRWSTRRSSRTRSPG